LLQDICSGKTLFLLGTKEPSQKKRLLAYKEHLIYIALIGVAPEARTNGNVGRELMEAITKVADELNVACFLECGGEKGRDTSMKLGFEHIGSERSLRADCDDGHWASEKIFSMARPPPAGWVDGSAPGRLSRASTAAVAAGGGATAGDRGGEDSSDSSASGVVPLLMSLL
jgi:hypothetical protein